MNEFKDKFAIKFQARRQKTKSSWKVEIFMLSSSYMDFSVRSSLWKSFLVIFVFLTFFMVYILQNHPELPGKGYSIIYHQFSEK